MRHTHDVIAHRGLWAAVLNQAMRDGYGKGVSRYQLDARAWLLSDSMEPTSFCWVCAVLGLDPEWIRCRAAASRVFEGRDRPTHDVVDAGKQFSTSTFRSIPHLSDEFDY